MATTRGKDPAELHRELTDFSVADRLSLKGKTFFITGGARGIGFACAKAIAQLGGGVAIVDALPEPTEEFHTLADRFGIKTAYRQSDVTKQESLEEAFTEVVAAVGGQLHGAFLAAGIAYDTKLIEADWAASQRVLDVNIMGSFWAAKLVARHLVDTKTPGSIVFTASLSAQGVHIPISNFIIYNASKAAIKGMVGPLAVELGPHNIRVNCISPGIIYTPMTASLSVDMPELDIFGFYTRANAAGRVGVPEDLTPMLCYLLSDAGAFSTGADHVITGGIHAGRCDHLDVSKFINAQ